MPLPIVLQGENQNPSSTINKIVQEAIGNIILLSDTPTSANGVLAEGRFGFISSTRVLYVTLGGNTYSFAALTLT